MQMKGVRIAHMPKAHLKPPCSRNEVAMGPPTHTVIMYEEEVKANIRDRFLSEEVSATKMEIT